MNVYNSLIGLVYIPLSMWYDLQHWV